MGMFGDFNPEDVKTDPFAAPVGTWDGTITEVSTYEYQGKTNLVFEITKDGTTEKYNAQFTVDGGGDKQETYYGFLKSFLLALEYPVSKMNGTLEQFQADFTGVPVRLTTVETPDKKNPDKTYVNIKMQNGVTSIRRTDIGHVPSSNGAPAKTQEPAIQIASDDMFASL